jgi:HK97 family phage prohead protease
VNRLEQLILEIRAGRVLSAKNESKLRAAIEALSEVISQLGLDEENSRASAVSLEQRTATITGLEIRAVENKPATILGHAALFNSPSLFMGFREIIKPGAFTDSLSGDIRALWQHDTARVLGRTKAGTLRLWEDDQGLAFELNPPDTTDGRDAVTLIERGDVDQMSFGFNVPSGGDSWSEDDDGIPLRELNKIGLMEISPVTWAAYPQTGVGVMRSAPEWVQHLLAQGVDDSSKTFEHSRVRVTEMLIEHDLIFATGDRN